MPIRRPPVKRHTAKSVSVRGSTVDGPVQTVVRTDLNWIRDGLLQAFIADADRHVNVGEVVLVIDEDRTIRQATVLSTDNELIKMQILPLATLPTPASIRMEPEYVRTWTFSVPDAPWGSNAAHLGFRCA
jgi:hypothetical protein